MSSQKSNDYYHNYDDVYDYHIKIILSRCLLKFVFQIYVIACLSDLSGILNNQKQCRKKRKNRPPFITTCCSTGILWGSNWAILTLVPQLWSGSDPWIPWIEPRISLGAKRQQRFRGSWRRWDLPDWMMCFWRLGVGDKNLENPLIYLKERIQMEW